MTESITRLGSVLLVDDDEVTNFYNEHLILKMGLTDHVHHSLNGREALDYLTLKEAAFSDYRRPDLILLDINMPIMNGFEFLDEYEKLPAEEQGHHLIVMLTTSMLEVDKERASKFGVLSEYIAKPLTEVQLAKVIQKIGGA